MLKKILAFTTLLIIFSFCSFLAEAEQLVILHSNDTHSQLFPFGNANNMGGIARMATKIKRIRRENPNVLAVNCGDVFVGSFIFNKYLGYTELKMMEQLYDAMCLGNHEFDLGLDTLYAVLSGMVASGGPINLPVLCANVKLTGTPVEAFVKPYNIRYIGPFKVGLFGVVTTNPVHYSASTNALMMDPFKRAGKMATVLKGKGCDVVIALSHLGLMEDMLGLSEIPGIDVIIGGHSHDAMEKPEIVNGKIIVQAGEFGGYLGDLRLNIQNCKITSYSYKLHNIDAATKKDLGFLSNLAACKAGIALDPRFGPVFTKKIAKAAWDQTEKWQSNSAYRDTPLGNLIADGIRKGVASAGVIPEGYPVIALEALGYTGHKIYKGKVTGEDIMRAVPYGYDPESGLGFKINAVLLAGAQLMGGLEYTVSMVEYTDDMSVQASGLTFAYDSSKPPAAIEDILAGKLSRLDPASIKIHGQPINPQGLYWVALSEALHNFLLSMNIEPFNVIETGLLEYNVIRDYMQELKVLKYKSKGRIIDTAAQTSK